MSAPQQGDGGLVVLISGRGSNLQSLIDAGAAGTLGLPIAAVISNRADAYGLERARAAAIPTAVVEHHAHPDRDEFDRALMAAIDRHRPTLVALAGFMRILTPPFVQHYAGRLLNIHPSLLPAYRGLDTHRRALEAGEREHGATIGFVTEELDGGPRVVQARVPVLPGDDPATLAARVLEQEHRLFPLAVRWFAEGRLRLTGEGATARVQFDGAPLEEPLRLERFADRERTTEARAGLSA